MSTDGHQWFQSVVIGIQLILLLALIIALYYAINKLWHFLAKAIDLLDKTNTKQELIGRSDVRSVDTIDKKDQSIDEFKPKTSMSGLESKLKQSLMGSVEHMDYPNNTDDYVSIDLDLQSVTVRLIELPTKKCPVMTTL